MNIKIKENPLNSDSSALDKLRNKNSSTAARYNMSNEEVNFEGGASIEGPLAHPTG
jgi:hypothetical protein